MKYTNKTQLQAQYTKARQDAENRLLELKDLRGGVKSNSGDASLKNQLREATRDHIDDLSFAATAILEAMLKDPKFAKNPLLQGLKGTMIPFDSQAPTHSQSNKLTPS